jgi:hypothetical protein
MKLNVPIGQKNLYYNNPPAPDDADSRSLPSSASNNLNWYVGEVHIVSKDVQPSANGNELRATEARDAFLNSLRAFYVALYDRTREKSDRLNAKKHLDNAITVAANAHAGVSARTEAIVAAKRVLDDKKRKRGGLG